MPGVAGSSPASSTKSGAGLQITPRRRILAGAEIVPLQKAHFDRFHAARPLYPPLSPRGRGSSACFFLGELLPGGHTLARRQPRDMLGILAAAPAMLGAPRTAPPHLRVQECELRERHRRIG